MRHDFLALCLLLTSVLVGCGAPPNAGINSSTSLSVHPAAASLRVGDLLQLQAVIFSMQTNQSTTPKGSWSSSDVQVAKVNSDGLLSGVAEGAAAITFVSSAGQSVDVAVAVVPKASSLSITPISASIKAGSSFQFAAAAVIDNKEQDVTSLAMWSIDNSLLGTASMSNGLLMTGAGSVGTQTVVKVTVSYAGLQASAPVFVNP